MNCKINPVLYRFYLRLNDTLEAKIVHRRNRKSSTCIEVVFNSDFAQYIRGHLNTRPEAEACGYWIMCRPQTAPGKSSYHGKQVFQLFLTPVHPKKKRAAKQLASETVFKPIIAQPVTRRKITMKSDVSDISTAVVTELLQVAIPAAIPDIVYKKFLARLHI